jgi:antitoxin YefM
MSIIPLDEVKDHLAEIVDQVQTTHERITITKDGQRVAVLIAFDELDSIEETLDILSTPGAIEQIKQAERDFEEGNMITAEEALAQHRARLC